MNLPFDTPAELFFVLAAALTGGILVKLARLQPIIGYIIAGVFFGAILPSHAENISRLAEVGAILLLFSVGIELSFGKIRNVMDIAILGAVAQMILVTGIFYFVLVAFGVASASALILASGFSLSSTAVVVKILSDRGEMETIHGEIMIAWLLVQDLAVIPMMVVLSSMAQRPSIGEAGTALLKALVVVFTTIVLGRKIVPFLLHKVASLNSRELLVLSGIALALGTSGLTSIFGISPALGAFLAGVVISESQENHAIFAETRPLRDLFVALFFVTLGFLVKPAVFFSNIWLILTLAIVILLIKAIVVYLISWVFGYRGRVAIAESLGLAQVGEFSFIIFSQATGFKLLSPELTSVGVATALLTLVATPFMFRLITPIWRKAKVNKFFLGGKRLGTNSDDEPHDHIIICGYGRVGGWVGKALASFKVPFVVVEYNQKVVSELRRLGTPVIYGDPVEPEVMDAAGLKNAKAVVLAIPDTVTQESLIAHIQTVAPTAKIISRAHLDEDWEKFKVLKVDKVVQPEFEASVAIIKSILTSMGKSKEDIAQSLKKLRLSHYQGGVLK